MPAPELSAMARQVAALRPSSRIPAPRTLLLQPAEWSYDWPERPQEPVLLGLRLPSGQDIDRAESVGRDAAQGDPDAGRAALMAFAAARGICDPNDITRPHPALELAEDMVPAALTRPTIARIVEALERLTIDTVPLYPEATDEELDGLLMRLSEESPLEGLSAPKAARVRRYLKFVLDELNE